MKISARAGRAAALIALLAAGAMTAAGCGSAEAASWRAPGQADQAAPAKLVSFAAPAEGAADVSTAVELTFTGENAARSKVTLTDATGAAVEGSFNAAGTAWVPSAQLKYATAYTATVTGPEAKEPHTLTFTTMAKPGKLANASVAMADGKTYGVAMPVVVTFGSAVAKEQRAAVEQRLLVRSEPAQVGVWHWFSDKEVHFRPKEYWQENTKLSVRLAVGGVSFGNKAYGAKDVTVSATIGEKLVMVTDDATHHMTVTKGDGTVLRTIPISLGKASTPSSSGAMVVMEKNKHEIFRSTDPSDPYETPVDWTQRTTWGGEYIHAAPWSVGSQGKRNVSHGCQNMSDANAKWLWDLTKIGDPVIIKGTPRPLKWGNGWTDWDRPWEEYVKGSALPAPTA